MAKGEIKQFINIYGEIIRHFSGVQTEDGVGGGES